VPLELHPLCTLDAELAEPIAIGEGPAGLRLVYEVLDATVEGDRLRGKLKGRAAADWVTVSGSIASLDVRATFETSDGALVFVQYRGRLNVGGGPIYVAPLFETGDERYSWLNAIQAVGKGELEDRHLHYDWFEVR
jgi:hypothetical protein